MIAAGRNILLVAFWEYIEDARTDEYQTLLGSLSPEDTTFVK
jgi:hypothetical protein